MHQALYRKWRPQIFSDVIGQNHITSVLKSEISNNKISHAYLFCGPRGTGKTTCAKIIAKAVNCENPVDGNPCCKCPSCLAVQNNTTTDIIEMDAASNNSVNDIRDIRDTVIYTPTDLKYRVYIIDEVHMLSISAFNALLKTLEEPPSYVIFVLATTELQKIPVTILSRCQRFDFHRVTPNDIIQRLKTVCEGENIKYDNQSLDLIAKMAQGSFRDALNSLEFCASENNNLSIERTTDLLGASPEELLARLCGEIAEQNTPAALEILDNVYLSSRDIIVFWRDLISFCRDMMLYIATRGKREVNATTAKTSGKFNISKLLHMMNVFSETESEMTNLPQNAKLYAEMALIRVCEPSTDVSIPSIVSRISTLEDTINNPKFIPSVVQKEVTTEKKQEIVPEKEKVSEKQTSNKIDEKKDDVKDETKLTLKAINRWDEIISSVLVKSSYVLGTMLKNANAYEGSDGKVYLHISSGYEFLKSQLESNENGEKLIEIINTVLKKSYTENDLVIKDTEIKKRDEKSEELKSFEGDY